MQESCGYYKWKYFDTTILTEDDAEKSRGLKKLVERHPLRTDSHSFITVTIYR